MSAVPAGFRQPCLAFALAALLMGAPLHAAQGGQLFKVKVVCWKDDAGRRACGNAVPPKYAKKERQILDSVGRTREVIPAEMTAEEREAAQAKAQAEAKAALARERQAAYDRALLQTYSETHELIALRNDRLATIDTRTDLTQAAARRDASALADLRSRLPEPGSRKKAHPRLLANIEKFEGLVAANTRAISELVQNRADICTSFTRDIKRFQEITLGRVDQDSPCPPPGAFAPKDDQAVDLVAAREFFDSFVETERAFDPAIIGLYSPEAIIHLERIDADGSSVQKDHNLESFAKFLIDELEESKLNLETQVYSAIKVTAEPGGRARVKAIRTDRRSKVSAPFEMVIKNNKERSWVIVEQTMRLPKS